MFQEVLTLLTTLAATICVLVLAFYGSRWYARRVGTGGGKHIKLVDRIAVSKTGSIVIIDVEGRQYLVGVSDASVQIMKELETPIPYKPADGQEPQNFFKALKTVLHKEKNEDE